MQVQILSLIMNIRFCSSFLVIFVVVFLASWPNKNSKHKWKDNLEDCCFHYDFFQRNTNKESFWENIWRANSLLYCAIVTKLLLEFFFNLLYQTWSLTHFGQEIWFWTFKYFCEMGDRPYFKIIISLDKCNHIHPTNISQ